MAIHGGAREGRHVRHSWLRRALLVAGLMFGSWLALALAGGTASAAPDGHHGASEHVVPGLVRSTVEAVPAPLGKALGQASREAVVEPVLEPVVQDVAEPTVQVRAAETVAQPVAERVARPVIEPVVAPVIEQVVDPVVQDVVEPVVAPAVQSVARPVVDPVVEPVLDAVVKPVVEPVLDAVVKPVAEPVLDAVVQPVADTIAAPVLAAPVRDAADGPAVAPVAPAVAPVAATPAPGSIVVPQPVQESSIGVPVRARVGSLEPPAGRFLIGTESATEPMHRPGIPHLGSYGDRPATPRSAPTTSPGPTTAGPGLLATQPFSSTASYVPSARGPVTATPAAELADGARPEPAHSPD